MSVVRRFLVAPSLVRLLRKERGGARITEGYFAPQAGRTSFVRLQGNNCFLVLVTGAEGAATEERTEVPRAHGDALLDVCAGKAIYERTAVALSGTEALIDRYVRPAGLDLVSLVFEEAEAAKAFAPPVWFGAEVSADAAYHGQSIALTGVPSAGEVPLSNAALDAVLDLIEPRFGTSRPVVPPPPRPATPPAPPAPAAKPAEPPKPAPAPAAIAAAAAAPAAAKPAEPPKPAQPAAAPKPAEAAKEAAAPAQPPVPKPAEPPKAAAPAPAPKPAEPPKAAEPPKPAPAPAEPPKAAAPAPAPKPAEPPKAAEPVKPAEPSKPAPQPAEPPKAAEIPKPAEPAKPVEAPRAPEPAPAAAPVAAPAAAAASVAVPESDERLPPDARIDDVIESLSKALGAAIRNPQEPGRDEDVAEAFERWQVRPRRTQQT
jgi:CYTH domain-containing protein